MHYIYHFACSSYLGYRYSRSVLLQMLGTQSVWTIDLALPLRRATGIDNGLRFLLCTTTLGAEDSYAEEAFYKQEFEACDDDGSGRCAHAWQTTGSRSLFY